MTVRERTGENEKIILCENAMFSQDSKGRAVCEEECSLRTAFQRDRDRIIHSKAFRRLKHKTQVFLAPEGDHYRTRLTHTLEVSQVARTIARALRLNEDLTEAIALGHDLGHTPFGHAGERLLDRVFSGGFKHYEQSLRVVERLERDGRGLNLTYEVRNGILCHTRGVQAETLEGRVVRIADKIAYLNHDIDDAIRAKVLGADDIPEEVKKGLGGRLSERIDSMVASVVNNSGDDIKMDSKTEECFNLLHSFMFEQVYLNPIAKAEEAKAQEVLKRLYEYFVKTGNLPEEYNITVKSEGVERAVCDYIAAMSDGYALHVYEDVFIPKAWGVL